MKYILLALNFYPLGFNHLFANSEGESSNCYFIKFIAIKNNELNLIK